jgi:hypothetical protein
MQLKLQFYVPIVSDPSIEMVTAPAVCQPGERDPIDWAYRVWDYRKFEYPLQITLRVDGQRVFVPLWLMKYQHEWVSDPFADDGDALGIGCDTFYVLKPFLPFTPADHALIEDDWSDSKKDHSIRTDYSMHNGGVLYTGEYPTRYSFTLIHKEIKGTLFRK